MKLIRFGEAGKEKPGVIINDIWFDVSEYIPDYDEKFFESDGLALLKTIISEKTLKEISRDTRLGPPIARPSKIICIGLNYSDHAKETGAKLPEEPVIFMKSTTALTGPFDNIIIPKNSTKTDWEVELAVVMEKKASYVDESEAMQYVGGYCVHNDISEREFQLERGGTWDKGKGCDTFAPMGPYFATKDEIDNVNSLRLWLKVNGQIMQDGNTSDFIFDIPFLVSYTSRFMTLLPGDIISTGTPAGVGLGCKPPVFLKPGDIVELGIDGLGTAKQTCVAHGRN
jgi:2-keto-4-pentenoate hydratase/2-oxohepta-3-ene-1,7-dioic acid hydratase in catechol pathway